MPNISQMIVEAHNTKASLDEVIFRANIKDSGEARVSATLCLTVAEQFAAALYLVEGGFTTHAPIVIRSMLEGLANLKILVGNSAYTDQIRFDDARSNVVLFTEYAAVEGMPAEAIHVLQGWREQAQPVLDELKAKGLKRMEVKDKFKLAGIHSEYVSYRVLCSFAHNQLTTLLSRHADRFELRYHDQAPDQTTASMLRVAVSILSQAIKTLPSFSDITEAEMQERLDAVDQAWGALSA